MGSIIMKYKRYIIMDRALLLIIVEKSNARHIYAIACTKYTSRIDVFSKNLIKLKSSVKINPVTLPARKTKSKPHAEMSKMRIPFPRRNSFLLKPLVIISRDVLKLNSFPVSMMMMIPRKRRLNQLAYHVNRGQTFGNINIF